MRLTGKRRIAEEQRQQFESPPRPKSQEFRHRGTVSISRELLAAEREDGSLREILRGCWGLRSLDLAAASSPDNQQPPLFNSCHVQIPSVLVGAASLPPERWRNSAFLGLRIHTRLGISTSFGLEVTVLAVNYLADSSGYPSVSGCSSADAKPAENARGEKLRKLQPRPLTAQLVSPIHLQ